MNQPDIGNLVLALMKMIASEQDEQLSDARSQNPREYFLKLFRECYDAAAAAERESVRGSESK